MVDATGQSLGRIAAKVAKLLRGKYKPSYTPHVDCGDNVIIINAEKVELTGKKWNDRIYIRFTGYPGGQRMHTPADLMKKGPRYLFQKGGKGMLPKIVWATNYCVTSMYTPVANIRTKLSNPKL